MPRISTKQNFIAYNETAITYPLHVVETEGSDILTIYLSSYTIEVHELF